ncbi:MAG: Prolyl-tRNA synthetase [Candidatus Beckwithbacteria bacterium GW2011_GWB1_47_15]|uniref:Proline--tRNA ligase n=1 Tax=Candidatus Beckwithbacteria bacterium GW2011_GWB1_47_15 TaxID=1618371 RepID=A0A0G1U536_9BACT|nr:MAG: prolyl-tRNA synthetase [Candidatus Beckwithbacteria bacterium GW2011_GWC1_49_16]KKU35343.1 MAG: Prolyl-tRNA synthetase [Candidatus Beckwithbacteria bacterium GW2011_GWA1_46_30]KKU61438.1 MAG: Prolyl-tRNA synthetase [Candidatus Beckwithbacteria bacterium GW2011_GWB1_47_15]KKU71845.1 MAG: Prolyl-tRNA synthetase [Candidatus Beckwithbacteria bacterium GW2011_GWA2_47_25]KKW03739.1 MAG: Prolyl-tRNA synthetase [Candidatus Beckwithbacteria bacterium GW2011_GWC2_49_11]OGD48790.1 MAG: hypothetic
MRYSQLFPKTKKEAPKGAESVNHKLLVRGGFIDQLMAGSWTLLPLGWRVVNNINQIIREEMNAVGGQEMLMPLLHPKEIWNETGRWDKADEIMYKLKDARDREYVLSFTHEEIVMDLLRKNIVSFKDLPVAVYHFSTKFRNEPRARSGILRGREFMMKDLYSAHTSEKDLMEYYEKVKGAYVKVFERLGFDYRVTEAGGGVFTDKNTHEFQVLSAGGEDTIFYCDSCDWGANQEIFKGSQGDKCSECGKGQVVKTKAIEVGNVFPLGTWYAEKMGMYFTDSQGQKKPVWFGSYGIGPTRVMGALVEVNHDERGIIWPEVVAPFAVHLVSLPGAEKQTKEAYGQLKEVGVEVLWDDREVSAGVKFADADLIGIPVRLVASAKSKDKLEWKARSSDKTELVSLDEAVKRLK